MMPPSRFHFFTAAFRPRAWRELAFHWALLGVSIFGFVIFIAALSIGLPLAVTVIGLFGSALLLSGARVPAAASRAVARSVLHVDVASPAPYRPGSGYFGWATARLTDAATWRSFAYLPVAFITSLFSAIVSAAFLLVPLGALTHALWGRYLPEQVGADGELHRGAQFLGEYVDTPERFVAFAAAGLILFLFVWPAVTHGLALMQIALIRGLLGQSSAERLRTVTSSRTVSVTTADARLRQIERDLHDGTQARLVALAMTLGDARERLAAGEDAASVATLVDTAHTSTKQALVELRDLASGIHPPALDAGLETALETVASTSALPVTFSSSLRERPSSVVESIVYFSVLELLTNAAKHAQASSASITLGQRGDRLEVVVADDGRGGAFIGFGEDASASGRGSGLRGLRERVGTVDGTLHIDSPAGGPTRITLDLPLAAR